MRRFLSSAWVWITDLFNLFFPSPEWTRKGEQEMEDARRRHEEGQE